MEPKTKTISFDDEANTRRVVLTVETREPMTQWVLSVHDILPNGITSGPRIWSKSGDVTEEDADHLNLQMLTHHIRDLYPKVWKAIQTLQK